MYIFWDNDGVLVDTERLYYQASREIMAEQGFTLDLETYRRHFLLSHMGLRALGKELGYSHEKTEALRLKRSQRYADLIGQANHAVPGAAEILQQLHGRIPMAVVTSSQPQHFRQIHQQTGFLPYFNFVLAKGDYARSKPYPDPYLTALDRAEVDASEVVVIEDSERGLIAAKAAGLACWVIPSELTLGSDFGQADRILESLAEVADLLSS